MGGFRVGGRGRGREHWIACLFTSVAYGRRRDPPDMILANTRAALEDLAAQVRRLRCVTL